MHLIGIDLNDKKNFNTFLECIEKSFPEKERTSIEMYTKFSNYGGRPFFIMEGEIMLGVCYCFDGGNITYIYYLAINESLRGRGFGSKTLKTLKKHFSDKPLALSIETISDEPNTLRRYQFYKANGFKEQNLYYSWQGVSLMLLSDQNIDLREYQETFGKLFNYYDYKTNIKRPF